MSLCADCGNDVFEEFEHCYKEQALSSPEGEWMRCKECYTEIDLDTFYVRLGEQQAPSSNNSVDHEGSAQDDTSGHQKIALCFKCDNAVFEDFEHCHKNGEKEHMKCKHCSNVIDLDTFTSRLGVEGPPALQGVSAEDLEAMKLLLFSWPCSKCDNDGEPNFTFIFDKDDVILGRSCNKCKEVMGLDNGMTPDQINQLLTSGRIRVKACECGNDDPFKMTLEQRGQDAVLVCSVCSRTNFNIGHSEVDQRCDSDIKLACNCGNKESELFAVRFDVMSGKPIRVTCLCCDTDAPVSSAPVCPCGSRDPELTINEYGGVDTARCADCQRKLEIQGTRQSCTGKTQIQSPSDLRPGDHVAWRRALGYWHHAIVTCVEETRVRIIEYGGNEEKAGLLSKDQGIIQERWVRARFEEEAFYRIDYREDQVYLPCEVIARARTRLGEKHYWLLSSNCEHFATWAKTGREKSEQVENFATYLKRMAAKGIHGAGEALANGMDEVFYLIDFGLASSKDIRVVRDSVNDYLPDNLIFVLMEAGFLAWDIWGYHTKYKQNEMTRDQFTKMTIDRSCRAVCGVGGAFAGGLAGGALGAAVGGAYGPVGASVGFYAGKYVGETLGFLLGSFLGNIAAGVAWKTCKK